MIGGKVAKPEISNIQYVYDEPLYAGCTQPKTLLAMTWTVTYPPKPRSKT